jgi:acetyltransferase-like isoleucine patch superfamily enzyme
MVKQENKEFGKEFKRQRHPWLYKLIGPELYESLHQFSLHWHKETYRYRLENSDIEFNLPLFQDQIKIEVGRFSTCNGVFHIQGPTNSKVSYKLKIGSYVWIGSNIKCILAENHTPSAVSNHMHGLLIGRMTDKMKQLYNERYTERYGDVEIGNDVWIGDDVIIRGGVKIGDGAVIGARALVTKDVPPFAIFAGVPARLIRYRFGRRTCESLESMGWWNWSEEDVKKRIEDFYDVEKFIKKYEPRRVHRLTE